MLKALHTRLSSLVLGLATAGLAACSPFAVVNGLGSDTGVARVETHAYGTHARQKLDLYTPDTPTGETIVFFYGGSWRSGDRADYRFLARRLAREGITVVVPDYRLYPEVRFPVFVEDAAAATAWVLDQARGRGLDPARVTLMGHSAGAHIALLVALDARYLATFNRTPGDLAGVIALSAPADFAATLGAAWRPIFTDQAGLDAAQPVRYVNATAPRMLLIHGESDGLVYAKNSVTLAARQRATGGAVELVLYPDMGHAGPVAPFSGWVGEQDVVRRVLDFVRAARAG